MSEDELTWFKALLCLAKDGLKPSRTLGAGLLIQVFLLSEREGIYM